MQIGEAIAAVKAGKVVSRSAWPPGVRVGCNEVNGVYVRTVDGLDVPWTPSTEDWFASDWGLGDAINHPAENVDEPTAWAIVRFVEFFDQRLADRIRERFIGRPPPYGPGFKRE